LAYQIPGLLLLLSALTAAIIILAGPRDRLWMVATVAATVVTVGMTASFISLSV
jgi:hypothetical protein